MTLRGLSLTLFLAGAALSGISCRDDSVGPTNPETPEAGPALATTAAGSLYFREVSTGELHSCGVATDNRAYCWGWNVFGQIGNGTTSYDRRTPALVLGGLRFRQITAGSYTTCGVTTEYRAYCWGNGILRPMAVPGRHLFRQLSAGESHNCGVTTDDRAYCWGINTWGQLGNGDASGNSQSMPVAVVGGLRFREVSASIYHTCGVTTADRAYCWGGDGSGQIGDGSASGACPGNAGNVLLCRKSPTLVAGGYRFRQVDAGGGRGPGEDGFGGSDGGRTCGVTTDDRAFCWGDGSHGQNGNGFLSMRSSPSPVAGSLRFRSVSAGELHTCGQTTWNRAYCWGSNEWGQIGDGTRIQRLKPVAVAGGLWFRQVSAGGFHTCGTTPGSRAYCWGYNGEGELGDGTTMRRLTPQPVVGPM